jgi:hypothetical protein
LAKSTLDWREQLPSVNLSDMQASMAIANRSAHAAGEAAKAANLNAKTAIGVELAKLELHRSTTTKLPELIPAKHNTAQAAQRSPRIVHSALGANGQAARIVALALQQSAPLPHPALISDGAEMLVDSKNDQDQFRNDA